MNNIFYVSRLGSISLTELESLFSLVGDVKSAHEEALLHSTVGTQFGVIEMQSEQQASDCIERFNGHEILGQRLSLSKTRPVISQVKIEIQAVTKRRSGGKR